MQVNHLVQQVFFLFVLIVYLHIHSGNALLQHLPGNLKLSTVAQCTQSATMAFMLTGSWIAWLQHSLGKSQCTQSATMAFMLTGSWIAWLQHSLGKSQCTYVPKVQLWPSCSQVLGAHDHSTCQESRARSQAACRCQRCGGTQERGQAAANDTGTEGKCACVLSWVWRGNCVELCVYMCVRVQSPCVFEAEEKS